MWQTRWPPYTGGTSPGMRIARQLDQATQEQPVANWGTVAAQVLSGYLHGRKWRVAVCCRGGDPFLRQHRASNADTAAGKRIGEDPG